MKQFLLFSLLCLLLFTLHGTTANLIHATCRSASRDNQNVKYSFCKSSLLSIPPAQRSNLQKLGIASINLIQKNVAATIGDINKQLKKKGLKRDVQRSITACLELYTQTIDDLSDAVENYKSKSFYDVTQDVSATSVAATACEDGFKEREVVSTLTTRNDDMGQLASIVLNIVDLYEKVS